MSLATNKLQYVFSAVGERWPQGSIGVLQAWLAAIGPSSRPENPGQSSVVLYAEPSLVLGHQAFSEFRLKSCAAPLQLSSSMPGRVWCTGSVQIIQNVLIVPPRLHPRTVLSDACVNCVSELVYMPVYDLSLPSCRPVAVLEVLFMSAASHTILIADFISFVSDMLSMLQMSLSNPQHTCPTPRPLPSGRRGMAGRPARQAPQQCSTGDEDTCGSISEEGEEEVDADMQCSATASDSASSGMGNGCLRAGRKRRGPACYGDDDGCRGGGKVQEACRGGPNDRRGMRRTTSSAQMGAVMAVAGQ